MGMVPDLSGVALGQYVLREKIGEGGMAVVYRAYQEKLTRDVAVKVLPASLAKNPQYEDRFKREAATAATLEHPHIVPIFDYGFEHGITFVAMRLLVGGSLADRLMLREQQRADLPSLIEVVRLLKQIGGALDYAHRRGVIHRDIKPSNIMFDEAANPFIVDFGIAKVLDATSGLTATGQTIGTPSFMAPEQWRAETPQPATDQYAVAVMIYAMLTGRVPFEAPTPYGLMHLHLHETPPPPTATRSDLPPSINAVINRAMAKRAEDRYPSISDFGEALAAAASGVDAERTNFFTFDLPKREFPSEAPTFTPTNPPVSPVSADGLAHAAPASPRGSRGWVWVAGLAVVLVLLAGGLFAALSNDGGTDTTPEPTDDTVMVVFTSAPAVVVATEAPTEAPTEAVTETLTLLPTELATELATASGTELATDVATDVVAPPATLLPTEPPTDVPTATDRPSATPTASLTTSPTASATASATATVIPTDAPTVVASAAEATWPLTLTPRTATVATFAGGLPVYAEQSVESDVVTVLAVDDVVGVLAVERNWARVFSPAGTGYVFTANLQLDSANDQFDDLLTQRGTIAATIATVYAAPSSDARERLTLPVGTPLRRLFQDVDGRFSFVLLDDDTAGWVLSAAIEFESVSASGPTVSAATGEVWPAVIEPRTATINSPSPTIDLHAGQTIISEVVATVAVGDVVGIVSEGSVWTRVFTVDGQVGYTFNTFLQFDTENDRFDELLAKRGTISTGSAVALYEAPNLASGVRFLLDDGASVRYLFSNANATFDLILTNDNDAGWILAGALELEAPPVDEPVTVSAATGEVWPAVIEPRTATINSPAPTVDLHAGQTIISEVVATVAVGDVVGIVSEGSVWTRVFTVDGQVGYTFNTFLQFDTENDRFDELLAKRGTITTNSAVALYEAPNLASGVRFLLDNGASVRYLFSNANATFDLILTNDNDAGWILAGALELEAPPVEEPVTVSAATGEVWPAVIEPRTATINSPAPTVDLHAGQTIISEVVATVAVGDVVGIVSEGSVWTRVFTVDGQVGYTFNTFLQFDTENDRFDELLAKRGTITTNSAVALYEAPNLASGVRFLLDNGASVRYLFSNANATFDLILTNDNDAGWILAGALELEAPPVDEPVTETTANGFPTTLAKSVAVVINVEATVVYAEPDLSSDVVATLPFFARAAVLESNGVFTQVVYSDWVGWVLTERIITVESSEEFDAFLTDEMIVTSISSVATYEAASLSAPVIATFEDGETVQRIYTDGTFAWVLLPDGRTGWMFDANLSLAAERYVTAPIRLGSCRAAVPNGTGNVRVVPATNAARVGTLGEARDVVAATDGRDGFRWYAIFEFDGDTYFWGWVREDVVTLSGACN